MVVSRNTTSRPLTWNDQHVHGCPLDPTQRLGECPSYQRTGCREVVWIITCAATGDVVAIEDTHGLPHGHPRPQGRPHFGRGAA